jgi:hypothetical protein
MQSHADAAFQRNDSRQRFPGSTGHPAEVPPRQAGDLLLGRPGRGTLCGERTVAIVVAALDIRHCGKRGHAIVEIEFEVGLGPGQRGQVGVDVLQADLFDLPERSATSCRSVPAR